MIERLARSTVQIFNEKNEPITDQIKAVVLKDVIRIFRPNVKIETGYFVKQFLDFGDDIYTVLSANYSEGLRSIPPSYELKVSNIKGGLIAKNKTLTSVVHNTINLGANSRVYQDSNDYSINTITQNANSYSQVINQLREEIKTLDLDLVESMMTNKIVDNIQTEASQAIPNNTKMQTLLSLLPVGVQALGAAAELGKIFGV